MLSDFLIYLSVCDQKLRKYIIMCFAFKNMSWKETTSCFKTRNRTSKWWLIKWNYFILWEALRNKLSTNDILMYTHVCPSGTSMEITEQCVSKVFLVNWSAFSVLCSDVSSLHHKPMEWPILVMRKCPKDSTSFICDP